MLSCVAIDVHALLYSRGLFRSFFFRRHLSVRPLVRPVPVVVVVVVVRPLSVSLSVLLCPSFRPVVRSVVVDVRPLSNRPVK